MSKTVVLIDDDPDDLDLLTEAIKGIDTSIEPVSFHNPEEALKFLTEELVVAPHYIFIDINMPIILGDHILKHLRRLPEYDTVVITVFSTAMSLPDAQRYKTYGANYTFQKPVVFDHYNEILKTIFLS